MDDIFINTNNYPELRTNTFTTRQNTTTVLSSPLLGDVLVQPCTEPNCTAAVIFLHGCGETGPAFHLWLMYVLGKFITFPHAKVLYPTAPAPPPMPKPKSESSSSASELSLSDLNERIPHDTQWFHEYERKAFDKEDFKTVQSSGMLLLDFINEELINKGIPPNRIIIGGFGQGGAMALHIAYRFCTKLAGVFTLSSYLSYDSEVYGALEKKQKLIKLYKLPPHLAYLPPVFFCYGEQDERSPFDEGEIVYKTMVKLGAEGEFHAFKNLSYDIQKEEIIMLIDWINKKLE